jgi:hypothetical protein
MWWQPYVAKGRRPAPGRPIAGEKMMVRRTRILPVVILAARTFVTPALAQYSTATPNSPARQQTPQGNATSSNYSDATIAKAGHALRDVLTINQTYRNKLTSTSDMATRRQIIADAKQQAVAAIGRDGLTVDQYNQILASARDNLAVRQRLLSAAGIPTQSR